MTSDERLAFIREKVDRAKQHIHDLKVARERFLAEEPARFATKFDSQTGEELLYITHLRPPPAAFGLMAGDAIHNLRSALDHLAWQLVLANGQTPGNQTAFPIFDDAARYQAGRNRYIQGMAQSAVDAIDATKPYKGGNDALWVLHRLDIADKHHALLTTLTSLVSAEFHVNRSFLDPRFRFGAFSLPGIKGLIEGQVFFTRQPEVHKEVNLTFDVSLSEAGVIERKPLSPMLDQMFETVDTLILAFTAYLS